MQTFWMSFGEKTPKTLLVFLGLIMLGCTSARENQLEQVPVARPVDRATPTVFDMNEQSSTVNRKKNIESRRPNDPATLPPEIRSQQVLPGRAVPAGPDTTTRRVRALPDTTRRQ